MLTNENSIDFGTTQLGGKLGSVKLPPWAQNPVDFIHKHRMALESEHVSANLSEWIDLIFGYKQRGKEAILANNMFFYISYEGTVDIDKISDPVQQRATQYQITYFGQTPSQLLTVPNMKKLPRSEVLHLQTIFWNPREVKPYAVPGPERCNLPAASIHASLDAVIIVDTNAPAAHIAEHKWQPNTPDGQGTPFLFQHGRATTSSAGGALIRMFKGPAGSGSDEWQFPHALALLHLGSEAHLLYPSHVIKKLSQVDVDNSIKLLSSDGAKTLETAFGHCSCHLPYSIASSNYLVTGSRDTNVLLWRKHRAFTSGSSSTSDPTAGTGTPTSTSSVTLANTLADKSRKRRIEGPIHVLQGHHKEILCCCVSSDPGIVVSCGRSSNVLLHSIRRGRLVRRFAGVEADTVCLSSEGIILTWNQLQHTLSTFTLNGILIATAQLPSLGGVSCMEISVDCESALIGMNSSLGNNGVCNNNRDLSLKRPVVDDFDLESEGINESNRLDIPSPSICFLDLHTLKVFHVLKLGEGQDITALALNKDNTDLLV